MAIIGALSTMRENHDFGLRGIAQEDVAAHRMRHGDVGRRTVGQHDILHEVGEVLIELGEGAHVALVGIGQHAARAALAAPVHGGDAEAAPAQVGHHLEVLLDELAAALEQADGAALGTARRLPAREAQLELAGAVEISSGGAARHRILGKRDQIHGAVVPPRSEYRADL